MSANDLWMSEDEDAALTDEEPMDYTSANADFLSDDEDDVIRKYKTNLYLSPMDDTPPGPSSANPPMRNFTLFGLRPIPVSFSTHPLSTSASSAPAPSAPTLSNVSKPTVMEELLDQFDNFGIGEPSSKPRTVAKTPSEESLQFIKAVKVTPSATRKQTSDTFDDSELLGDIECSTNGFPERYKYLLEMSTINDLAIMQHPELYRLITTQQTTEEDIIEKETAIICLHWAQAIIDSCRALLRKICITYKDYKIFKSRTNPKKKVCRLTFKVMYEHTNLDPNRRRFPHKGMLVYFVTNKGSKKMAKITESVDNHVTLSVRCSPEAAVNFASFDNEPADIYEVSQEFTTLSMLESIEGMKSGILHQVIIPKPEFTETHEEYLRRKKLELPFFLASHRVSPLLTDAQKDALFAICKKEHGDTPFVLFGPPGTGKTFTISQTIQTILRMSERNRVLVCTPSNMAADRVAEQLMKDFGDVLNETNVLRFRSIGNDFHARDRRFDRIIVIDVDYEQYVVPKTFMKWKVIVCTLAASSHIAKQRDMHGYFSHIIIDEAGQCSEAELWIPLGRLANTHTSIILCGDPKQLGPVITLDISKQLQREFTSPLVRYMNMEEYQTDTRLCCQLIDCFRCHKSLVRVISALFYQKRLRPIGIHDLGNFNFEGLRGMHKDFPILFLSTYSDEEKEPTGYSYRNTLEAKACVNLADLFVTKKGLAPEQIGIISPYKYQTRTIRELLNKHQNKERFRQLTVDSVERFQGSERSVIIMTATRTTTLGFMADDLRVNTSLTRAQNILIIVGNADTLRKHPAWKIFLEYCQKFNALVEWY